MLRREKRQNRRILVSVEAEVKLSTVDGTVGHPAPIRGTVTNLSTTGLSIRLPEAMPIGTMMRVMVKLADKQAYFYAAVRRAYPATAYHPSEFGHGLQIVAAPEESIDRIYEYMMTVTGRAAMLESAKIVEAFPATATPDPALTTSDQSSSEPQKSSPAPLASPG